MSSICKTGVLVVNLGTPDQPTPQAVRRYLAEFLHDKRVVDLSRWIWCPVLHGIILRFRPAKVAKLYQSIWTKEGAPLLVLSQQLASQLEQELNRVLGSDISVVLAMNYGNPSIASGLQRLSGCQRIIVLPLYPQYSSATSASVMDRVIKALSHQRNLPALSFIRDYHDHPKYIDALAQSVERVWNQTGQSDVLLMSFHGIPERYYTEGDPYPVECRTTASLLAERLNLTPDRWQISFQSRFGREPWLKPYTDEKLIELAKSNKNVDVICPGFAVDCLETLEEIQKQNKILYLHNGGGEYRYIACLNDSTDHVQLLADLVKKQLING